MLTGKVFCVVMLVKRSTLQRLHDKSRFCVNSVVRRSYMIRYINIKSTCILKAHCLICIPIVFIMAESTTDEHRPEGYDEDFVEAVDEDLQCLICHLPLKEPIQTKCGHRFCKDCLEEYIRRYKFMINKILPIMDPCNLVLILFNHSRFIRGISWATESVIITCGKFLLYPARGNS